MAGYGGHSGHNAYSDAYGAHYHPSNLPPIPFSSNDQHDPYQYPLAGQGRDQYQYPASGRGHDQYQQPASGHGQDPHQYPPQHQMPGHGHSQPPSQMMSPVGYDHPDQTALIGEGEYIGKRKTGGRKALAGKATAGVHCACCCVFILVLLGISIVVGHLFTRRHHDWEQPIGICPASADFCLWNQGANLVPSNLTRYLAWNGCGDHKGYLDDATINACGPPCFDAKLVRAMDSFNNQSAWTYVSFLSKAGVAGQQQLTLTAWWLPADPMFAQESADGQIPVVVIQHTNNANFDSRMVQTYAYLLRSMGFSVFLPNLRDHGSSQKSTHPNRVT